MKLLARAVSVFFFLCFLNSPPVLGDDLNDTTPAFFPVFGITLGKTTLEELDLNGEPGSLPGPGEASGAYFYKSIKFGFENRIIVKLELVNEEPLPQNWRSLGLDWDLSYEELTALIRKMGLPIKLVHPPTLLMEDRHPVFKAEYQVYIASDYPTVLIFNFSKNRGTGASSKKVLHKISAYYSKDPIDLLESSFRDFKPVQPEAWKRRALALSGITSEIEGYSQESLEMEDLNQLNTQKWRKILTGDWGITNQGQFLEKLSLLEQNGFSKTYQDLARILQENPELTINEIAIKNNYDSIQVRRLFWIKEKQGIIGKRALRAWDYSQMVTLCRAGYQAGFISSDDAWKQLQKILTAVEGLYYSWEDFAANYILGRMFWAMESGDETMAGNDALQAYAKLITQENGAWNLSWEFNAPVENKNTALTDVLYFPSDSLRAWDDYVNGWRYYERGQFKEAEQLFNLGLTHDPGFTDLWLFSAMASYEQGSYQKAIEGYRKYLSKRPTDYYALIYLGEVYEKSNQVAAATETYERAVDISDTEPEGFIGLGRVAINSNRYELAISYLRIAESLSFRDNQGIYYTLYLLGYSYYKTEKYEKALSYFLRVQANYRDDAYLNYYIGICYLYNQNYSLASGYLKRAEELGLDLPAEIKNLLNQNS